MGLGQLLLIAFIVVPLVEIYLLIQVGGLVGAGWTVGLVVITAITGAALVRGQGLRTAMRLREQLDRGEMPAQSLFDAAVLLFAGALLLTPGFLTDAVGFAFLVPRVRVLILRRLIARAMEVSSQPAGGRGTRVYEGEFRREDD